MFKAGAAAGDVTPPIGTELCGYGPYLGRKATGVLDPLVTRVLYLDNGEGRALLVEAKDTDSVSGMLEQSIDQTRVRQGVGIGNKLFNLLRTRRKTNQVEPKPSAEYARAGHGVRPVLAHKSTSKVNRVIRSCWRSIVSKADAICQSFVLVERHRHQAADVWATGLVVGLLLAAAAAPVAALAAAIPGRERVARLAQRVHHTLAERLGGLLALRAFGASHVAPPAPRTR